MSKGSIDRTVGQQSKGARLQRLRAIKLILDEMKQSPDALVCVACEYVEDIYMNKEDNHGESSEYIESDKSYKSKNFTLNSAEVTNSLVSFLDCHLDQDKNFRYGFYTNTGISKESHTDLLKRNNLKLPKENLIDLLVKKDYPLVLPYIKCIILDEYERQYAQKDKKGYLDEIKKFTNEMWIDFLEKIEWKFNEEDELQLEETLVSRIQELNLYKDITISGKERHIINALDKELERRQANMAPIHRLIVTDTVRRYFLELGVSPRNLIPSANEYENFFDDILKKNLDKFFVETSYYKSALQALEQDEIVILVGKPGIGKTITSERIALEYRNKGFKILRSEQLNIGNAKNLLKENPPKENTLIILNDFLGQSITEYKETNHNELNELNVLFRLLNKHEHIKLLINTRGVIYQEARQNHKVRYEFTSTSNNIREIHIENLSLEEKSQILYHHLQRSLEKNILNKEHYQSLIQNKKYLKIITHDNFTPRIVDYITSQSFVEETESQSYCDKIFKVLDYPAEIWKNEYDGLEKIDRMLLHTLFSLTNTNVPMEILKQSFEERIKSEKFDTTINHFDHSMSRLKKSLLRIEMSHDEERVGVLNPSINDFLHNHLLNKHSELETVMSHSLYYEQVERLINCGLQKKVLVNQIKNGMFKKLKTFPREVFLDIDLMFQPPLYLYKLKVCLIHLDERDLKECGIDKLDVQNFIHEIFEKQYNNIEINSRLYFAYEFSVIFEKMIRKEYDLSSIITENQYFTIIMNSIVKCDAFWDLFLQIQKKYYPYTKAELFGHPIVQSNIIDHITSEVIEKMKNYIAERISKELEENDEEIEDYEYTDDIIEFIREGVEEDIYDELSQEINTLLDKYNINWISIEKFDIDGIISEDINIDHLIEQQYNDMSYRKNDEEVRKAQKFVADLVKQFESEY